VLRNATQAWTVALVLLFAVAVCLLITGLDAARDAYVGSA
jgi:cyanate permease